MPRGKRTGRRDRLEQLPAIGGSGR